MHKTAGAQCGGGGGGDTMALEWNKKTSRVGEACVVGRTQLKRWRGKHSVWKDFGFYSKCDGKPH